jgi:prepilin-type N-terminal cleavage/methylation domain-containing protein
MIKLFKIKLFTIRLFKNKKHSFTLIELIIVVIIIGLLSTMAMAAVNVAGVKTRDTKRITDINQITKALELSFAFNNSYPVPPDNATKCLSECTDSNWCANLVTQMPRIPNDPQSTQQCYLYNSDGVNFRVAAKLESTTNYDKSQNDSGLYPQFYEGESAFDKITLASYETAWPSLGLNRLDPNYSNLVNWWDFEEGKGEDTADFSPSSPSHTGTLSDQDSWQDQCSSGECVSFDGTNYIESPDFGMTGTVVVVSTWVKCKSNATENQTFLADGVGSATTGYLRMWRPSNTDNLVWSYANGTAETDAVATNFFAVPFNNMWTYVVIVSDYAGKKTYFYQNGTLFATVAMSGTPVFPSSNEHKNIGARNPTVDRLYDGSLDDIRLYDTPLTASQICHLCREKRSASFCHHCSK